MLLSILSFLESFSIRKTKLTWNMPGIYVKVGKGEGKMVIDGCIDQVLLLYKCLSLALYTHGD